MKTIKIFAAVSFVLLLNSSVLAVPAPPVSGGPACWPPPCVPIDGGVLFLIFAGAALAAKTFYDFRKKSKSLS